MAITGLCESALELRWALGIRRVWRSRLTATGADGAIERRQLRAAAQLQAQPILRFVVTRTTTINLTGTGSTHQFVPHCSKKGPLDAIVADLPFDSLRQIAQATDVTVDALGFSLRLASADLAAWRLFVRTVEGGVTFVQNNGRACHSEASRWRLVTHTKPSCRSTFTTGC
jgi:hypothetical protein